MEGFPKSTAIASDRLFVDFFPGWGSASLPLHHISGTMPIISKIRRFWGYFFLFYTLLLALNYYRQIMGHFLSKNFSDYPDFPADKCIDYIILILA